MSTLKEIEKIIAETGKKSEILQLNFTGIKIERFTPQIKKAIQQCKALQILILAECELVSLDNLPNSDLNAVDFSGNKLADNQLAKLAIYKNLGQLIFVENLVAKVQSLKCFLGCEHLQEIDFSDNPVAQEQNYRDWVFDNLKQVEVVDRKDKQGNQVIDEGQFQDDEEDDMDQDLDDDQDDQDEQQFDQDQEESQEKPKKKK